ncbi:uncharacterized protein LOC116611571 [Nematostella vectensis]|uniref:uncharacterized protein LOC116611571 n=1 Tax=Nematostella vectensis TaxID=45351 RepID=UPI0013905D87|nr:uncharacterized protein LOC116611571 [Nematostella vectensis]
MSLQVISENILPVPDPQKEDESLHKEIFSSLKEVSSFLVELRLAHLSDRHEKERGRLEKLVSALRLKIAEHVHSSQRYNCVKSPRPVRKTGPSRQNVTDSLYTFSTQLHHADREERKKSLSPELLRRTSYSPEAKRRLEVQRPKIRPRSISCPEIKYIPPHSWKTSLAKVPENEEEDEGPRSPKN